jgi:aspartate 1-decarboxylase
MQIQVLKSKFTGKVTGADLNYIGSYYEIVRSLKYYWRWKVSIVNINNGERWDLCHKGHVIQVK